MIGIRCEQCGASYPNSGMPHHCEKCGGMFDYDGPFPITKDVLQEPTSSLWQYRSSFGLSPSVEAVSLGEGNTPLLRKMVDGHELAFKMESNLPTGSYKDRGTTLLVSELKNRAIPFAVEDSSGNAGASFATYCSWAGVNAKIFIPESASGAKRKQIERSNAQLQTVPGARANATQAVMQAVEEGAVYASHAFQPFLLPGIATIAYELFTEMQTCPGTIIAPVGHGGLFLGIMRGFDALYQQKIISKTPFFLGVQGAGYTPFLSNPDTEERETLADGVRIKTPSRYSQIMKMTSKVNCEFTACSNESLQSALLELWKMGLYVEITSALVWAAYRQISRKLPEPIVFILTGSGLKY